MKIDTQELENHRVKLTVETDSEPLEQAKRQAAAKLAKRTKIPGFRPGKAPYAMVVKHLGDAVILEEAIEILIDDLYPKVIEESGVKTYGPGKLDEITSLEPPTFEFIVALAPVIVLGDYHAIRIPYETKEVNEDEIEKVIANLRSENAVIEQVERPAQVGDQVRLRFSATRLEPDGNSSSLYRENQITVILPAAEEDIDQNLPFPGFEQSLVGKSAGETATIPYTYPEDTAIESLRGVEAEYQLHIEQVYSRTLPDVDDELAQTIAEVETLAELRETIRKQMEEHAERVYNSSYDEQIMDQLLEISTVEYPPEMLEHEIDHVIDELKNRLENQGLDLNLYLRTRGIEMEDLREETRDVAETRLKKSLIFMEISETEDIRFDPQELERETMRTVEYYSRIMPEKEFKKLVNQKTTSGLIGNIMSDLIIDNTKEFLRDIARGKEPRNWTEEADDQIDLATEPESEVPMESEPTFQTENDTVSTSEE